jgi:hypothetical protein
MDTKLKSFLFQSLQTLQINRLGAWLNHQKLAVFTYHSIVDIDQAIIEKYPFLYRNAITLEKFEQHLKYLRENYYILDGEELEAILLGGDFPAYSLIITFDDGLMNNATVASPVLARLGLKAIFFLPTSFIDAASDGKQRYHWSEEIVARLYSFVEPSDWHQILSSIVPAFQGYRQNPFPIHRLISYLKSVELARLEQIIIQLQEMIPGTIPVNLFPCDRFGNSILDSMTWKQAIEISDLGMILGSHTENQGKDSHGQAV